MRPDLPMQVEVHTLNELRGLLEASGRLRLNEAVGTGAGDLA